MVVANALLNFVIVFGLFTGFLVITGNFPGVVFLGIVPLLAILVAFAVGLGITLGILNVFFRDVGQFFGIVLQFWFWLTPIVYPLNVLPTEFQSAIAGNPMTPLVTGFQAILVHGRWPQWDSLAGVALLSAALCALGLHLFRKRSGELVDEL